MAKKSVYFGAGCFWGVQVEFDKVKGVIGTEVGYMGGNEKSYPNPTYKQVCTDETRYAETVKVEFDLSVVSYEELVRIFLKIHDPTQLNRQGLDIGTQYRSVIFYLDEEHKKIAEKILKKRERELGKKIVTVVVKAGKFYRAEEYHQKYHEKHGGVC